MCRTIDLSPQNIAINTNVLLRCYAGTAKDPFVKVHLTPNFFFAKIIRLISWSNVAQKFLELVKSSNFYAPSKYVKMPPFWFATEFNGAWVEAGCDVNSRTR